jgi:hypothetical protein
MTTQKNGTTPPTFTPLPVQLKLAAAWTSFMFLYVYVDLLGFFRPGVVEDILAGVVWEFQITQTFLVIALGLMAIPIAMIALSTVLPARANRIANLVVASLYVPVSVFNAVGESWTYYFWLAIGLEVAVLAMILGLAWTLPYKADAGQVLPPDAVAASR